MYSIQYFIFHISDGELFCFQFNPNTIKLSLGSKLEQKQVTCVYLLCIVTMSCYFCHWAQHLPTLYFPSVLCACFVV